MNNRILAALFALALALFIGVAPVEAEAAHEHQLVYVPAIEATHGSEGQIAYYICSGTDCRKVFKDEAATEEITDPKDLVEPKVAHDIQWKITETTHKQYCTGCGYVPVAEEAHSFKKVDNGDGTHTKTCTVCGYSFVEAHFEGSVTNCICGSCGAEMEHTPSGWKVYPSDSTKHFTQCTVCYKTLVTESHDYTTFTPAGNHTHSEKCEICGYVNPTPQACYDNSGDCICDACGSVMAHSPVLVPEVPATCTTSGTEAYYKCRVCGKTYQKVSDTQYQEHTPQTIPATGHLLSGVLVEDVRLGQHYQECAHQCGYREYSEHEFTVTDPLMGNYHQFMCKCGATKTEVHYNKDGDKKCDECGHDMANTTVKVEQHDSIKVTTGDKSKVDNTKTWWQNWWNGLTSSNAGSQTSGNTPAASATTGTPAAPAESGDKPAPSGGSTGTESGTQSEKSSTGTGSQSVTQKPSTETVTQNPDSATAQNSFRNILFQVWNWLNGLFASK